MAWDALWAHEDEVTTHHQHGWSLAVPLTWELARLKPQFSPTAPDRGFQVLSSIYLRPLSRAVGRRGGWNRPCRPRGLQGRGQQWRVWPAPSLPKGVVEGHRNGAFAGTPAHLL